MRSAIQASALIASGIGWAAVLVIKLATGGFSIALPSWVPSPVRITMVALFALGWLIPVFCGISIFWRIGLRPRLALLAKVVWVLGSAAILIVMSARYDASGLSGQADIEFRLAMMMGTLSFPAGIVAAVAHNLCVDRHVFPSGRNGMMGSWALFFIAGYVQWFVLVPAARVWLKKRAQEQRWPSR